MGAIFALLVDRGLSALKSIGDLILKYPVPAAAIGLAMACGILAHQRDQAIHDRDIAREQLAQATQSYRDAQVKARNEAITERAAVEQRYQTLAEAKDHDYHTALTTARSAAAAYIRSHPVRMPSCPADSSPTREAVASADDHRAGLLTDVPADAVLVSASDVQVCTSAVTYALTAHEWALQLREP